MADSTKKRKHVDDETNDLQLDNNDKEMRMSDKADGIGEEDPMAAAAAAQRPQQQRTPKTHPKNALHDQKKRKGQLACCFYNFYSD
mmetsp:Transcript_5040/g.10413  ORF Transcript_5040/g.10413 Transcript_5040/m.10413 type:complete len:86 (+) Transcript_5040:1006-1263(+)